MALRIKSLKSFELLGTIYPQTQCHVPEHSNLQQYCSVNLRACLASRLNITIISCYTQCHNMVTKFSKRDRIFNTHSGRLMIVVTATSSEEARNPAVSIPVATVVSMSAVTLGYILVSAALTLMVPYWTISTTAALPEAFSSIGLNWAKYVVSIGALCGMTTTLFGSLFSLPRCMYAMATDGLLFSFLGSVNQKTQVRNNHHT